MSIPKGKRRRRRSSMGETVQLGLGSNVPETLSAELVRQVLHLDDTDFGTRYKARDRLGRGGMGEVRSFLDDRIGREVALKELRTDVESSGESVARFVREARVQGQLEHPSIPPVYDLGVTPDGAPYFTMKRLRGETLKRIVRDLADGDPEVVGRYPLRRLLSEFADACKAIEYAHSRGVIHRDLKPANIMLGDFGEIYVLDWGVAWIQDPAEARSERDAVSDTSLPGDSGTSSDVAFGTPGFMAPEQWRTPPIDARTDVFALGAILFEVLTLEPLVSRGSRTEMRDATLAGLDARCSVRAPGRDVPPELEAICVRATVRDREMRYQSVAEMVRDLDAYLDGDRDVAVRKQLASAHSRTAREALIAASDPQQHAAAMREAGRALVLDPLNADAAGVLMKLLVEPPAQVPPEVKRDVAASAVAMSQYLARVGSWCYLLMVAYIPLVAWMGVRSFLWYFAASAGLVGLVAWNYIYSKLENPSFLHMVGSLMLNAATLMLVSRWFGPLVLIPGVACASSVIYSLHGRPRWWSVLCAAMGVATVFVPLVLQGLGFVESAYEFRDGQLVVLAIGTDLPAVPTLVALSLGALGMVGAPVIAIGRLRRALYDAEERLHLQAWQLRQLVPEQARDDIAQSQPPRFAT